jgi:peptide deformylase
MAVREIIKYPHPTLKKRSNKVDHIDDELRDLIRDMIETMYSANGVGLAACQVGVLKRVVVLDVSPMDPEKTLHVLINPEVVSYEGEVDSEEGCLSVPECTEKVKRKAKVCVKCCSPEGKEVELTGEGILAIALQHEIDHLDGTLILDRISGLKRELYRNKLKKEKRKEEPL